MITSMIFTILMGHQHKMSQLSKPLMKEGLERGGAGGGGIGEGRGWRGEGLERGGAVDL